MFKFLQNIWSYILGVKLHEFKSDISGKLELWLINGKKVLNSANANYSFDSLHQVFQDAFLQVRLKLQPNADVLILGFGGGSVAHILQKEYRFDCKITGVDVDALLFEIAQMHFDMNPSDKLQFITADAHSFVLANDKKYDLIVVDIFVDNQVPKVFAERTFIEKNIELLDRNGQFFINIITSHNLGMKQFDSIMHTLHAQAGKITVLRPTDGNAVIYFVKD